MNRVFRLLILASGALGALALQACSRSHPASTAEVQEAMNSQPQIAALQSDPSQTLVHVESIESSNLRTEKYQHYINGIEVLGSGAFYHEIINHSETHQVTAHLASLTSAQVDTNATLTNSAAISLAQKIGRGKAMGEPALKIFPSFTKPKLPILIYQVDLDNGKQVWLDAHNATHLATLRDAERATTQAGAEPSPAVSLQVVSALDQGIHVADSEDTLPAEVNTACQSWDDEGLPILVNPHSCTDVTKISPREASAERAIENAQKFLEYFQSVHDRNSFDGKGSPIISVIHVGQHYDNALWHKQRQFLGYGDGDGITTRDYTYALDIAGHELTHGVIQSTAALISMGETGALNESIADFFGKMIEGQGSWTIGESLGLTPTFLGIRDLKNPGRINGQYLGSDGSLQTKPYPVTREQMAPVVMPCTDDNDFCAVHFNATIPGHFWYGIYQRLGQEKAEKLLYVTLSHFLSELADFEAAAKATESACSTILTDADCKQVTALAQASLLLSP